MKNSILAVAAIVIATTQVAFGVTVSAHAVTSAHPVAVSHSSNTAPVHVVAVHESEAPTTAVHVVKPAPVVMPIGHVSAASPSSSASAVKGK